MTVPRKIAAFVEVVQSIAERQDRIEMLISVADRYRDVSPAVASRPFDSKHLVPHCESEVYFWPVEEPGGTLKLVFAVENPQGISARAMAVILDEALSGEPLEEVAGVEDDLPLKIFGSELSMGKTMGLNSMVAMVRLAAQKRLQQRQAVD